MKKVLLFICLLILISCDSWQNEQKNSENYKKIVKEQVDILNDSICDCSKLISRKTDKMTDRTSIKSEIYTSSMESYLRHISNGIISCWISWDYDGATLMSINFKVSEGDFGCVDRDSKIIILFTNGEKITLENYNDFNCDGYVESILGTYDERKQIIDMLSRTKIKTVRLYSNNGYIDADFDLMTSTQIMKSIKCYLKSK